MMRLSPRLLPANESENTFSKNLTKWLKLLDAHGEDLPIKVEYEVELFQENPFNGTGDNTLRRNVKFLPVAFFTADDSCTV